MLLNVFEQLAVRSFFQRRLVRNLNINVKSTNELRINFHFKPETEPGDRSDIQGKSASDLRLKN